MDNITFAKKFLEPKRTGNPINDLNPLSKLNIFLVLGLSVFLVGNYRYGIFLVAMLFIVAIVANCLKQYFKVYWKVLLMFGVFLFAMKSAFAPGETILWQKWGIHVSKESIHEALVLSSSVTAFCGAIIMFSQTTKWEDLAYALEKKGLSHVTSFVILSSFQTISDLGVNARIIMDSQRARGIETEGNLLKRVKAYIPVMGPLILNSISGVEEKSIAMDARAFSAPGKHTSLVELPEKSFIEKTIVILVNTYFGVLVLWRIITWLI